MYHYRIALPVDYSDELAAMLRDDASLEGVVALPSDLREDDPLSVHSDSGMAVFVVHDYDGYSIEKIKSWLDGRADSMLDVRGEEPGVGFVFSFARNNLEDIAEWAARQTARAGGH